MAFGAMWRLSLVIAVILSSAAAHPLVPGSEPLLAEGATRQTDPLSVDQVCKLIDKIHTGKYQEGFRALPDGEEFQAGGVPPEMQVSSPETL